MAMMHSLNEEASNSAVSRRALLGAFAAGGVLGFGASVQPALAAVTGGTTRPSAETDFAAVSLPTAYDNPLVVSRGKYLADTKRVLVVIDYQVDFVDGEVFGRIEPAVAIENALYGRIGEYQERGDIVVYTMDTHPSDGYSRTRESTVNPQHCDPDSPGWAVYGKVRELLTPETAIEVRKGTYGSLQLPLLIRGLMSQGVRIESIEIAGVSTTCRVLHNAIILFNAFPELPFIMDASTTAGYSDEATIEQLEELESWGFVIRW